MWLLRYLRDHVATLVLFCAAAAMVWLVLGGVGLVSGVRELVLVIMVLFGVLALGVDYGRQVRFWRQLEGVVRADEAARGELEPRGHGRASAPTRPGNALDAAALVEEPRFSTGRVSARALDAVSQTARDEVADAQRLAEEHRSYIETWVHEVKTPIAAAHLIVDNHPGPDSASLAHELDRIDAYVEQALYVARSNSLERDYAIRACDLSELVGDAVKSRAHALIEDGVHVSMEGVDQPVLADAKWVGFILGQLLDNSVKYRARSEVDGREPEVSFSAERLDGGTADERVVLVLADNGIGIPASDVGRVFDKGFVGENGRRADQGRSTGIGLWLVRRLCDKMGLGITLASTVGEGTRVRLTFPANRMHYLDE
ncbi:MAG: sensor histidine kinase [Atopobiaceae bacterium]|jgi:signal transduction histidine kinase|nr:sensor histidine kinase [Atopobiaceae bacterium]MCH4180804.1 sensor histidine kinase [Atopobiaceae bacterium]MCH4214153.1 sensor histidine kinase [Atopobiaceae bacterium]MCH4229673.1 sensor histidine kinase [Atopobiaceae bacterium]MCH4276505.1 sensor histidine kinase [Atopobiaceae bacterium]